MVELRQFRQFVAVAEALSFRRAAAKLNMSQPPLSHAIKRLEAEIGKPLLERNRRLVRLTPAGLLFLHEARRALAQADHAVSLVRSADETTSGSLRVSFVASAALGEFPAIVRRFNEKTPGAVVQLDIDTTGNQLNALHDGRSDLALLVVPIQDRGGLEIHPFRSETIHIALPSQHRLAGRETIEISELADENFITFPFAQGPGFESVFLASCNRAGFSPEIKQEVTQMLTKIALVAVGAGVALVPSPFSALSMSDVVLRPLFEGKEAMRYTLAFAAPAKTENPLVNRFLEIAQV